jgi:hypothetical protein
MNDFTWSKAEKEVARKAFDQARAREYEAIRGELKSMINSAKDDDVIWRIHEYLSERRREVGEKYDYRYSVLPLVFAQLIREGWLSEEELSGLREDKLEYIQRLLRV